MSLRVGLTGGIACGKSHVLRGLAEVGLPTLDLDQVAHRLIEPGAAAYEDVVREFGRDRILAKGGRIDRKALGAIVFADPAARSRLNAIVHPRVRSEELRWAVTHANQPVIVTDAALLVEVGLHLRFDRLIVVHCDPAEQLRRLIARDGVPEAAARARIAAQMPVVEKRGFAHFEIDTSGSVAETLRQSRELGAGLLALAAHRLPPVRIPQERALAGLVAGPQVGPRGLSPRRLLEEIVGQGGLDLQRLGESFAPGQPWYRAPVAPGPPAAETLAVPLVLWALVRGGPDPEFLAAAASSVAVVTHNDPASRAGAVLVALAGLEAAVHGVLSELRDDWLALAAHFGGSAPSPEALQALAAAREFSAPAGEVAAALVALAGGAVPSAAAPDLADLLVQLSRLGP